MKKLILFLIPVCLSICVLGQKQFVVDANAQQRSLNGSFNAITVSGGIDIYLSQSDNEAIAVSASEDRYIDGIKTIIENNTLKIYYEGDKGWNRKNKNLRAYVSFKELEKLEASGASDIVVSDGIKVSSLLLKLSGASDFKGDVTVSTLKLELSGASDVVVSGTATVVNIESSGASDVKGYDLKADVCTAKVSGASDVTITVNKELNAHASGASGIYYKGQAVTKNVESSGASTISRKD